MEHPFFQFSLVIGFDIYLTQQFVWNYEIGTVVVGDGDFKMGYTS